MNSNKLQLTLTLAFGALAASLQATPIVPTFDTFGTLSAATFGGSGIPNTAVAIKTIGDVTLGLTAHQRYVNPPLSNNGAGDFYAVSGGDTFSDPPNTQPGYARWNFAFYVANQGNSPYLVDLFYDFDPGSDTDGGDHGKITFPLPKSTTVQDSWNLGMSFLGISVPGVLSPPSYSSFNPNVSGEYTFALVLRNSQGELGRTAIRVNVVPDAGSTVGLLGLGLIGLTLAQRRW
jgi:hypothetical protein